MVTMVSSLRLRWSCWVWGLQWAWWRFLTTLSCWTDNEFDPFNDIMVNGLIAPFVNFQSVLHNGFFSYQFWFDTKCKEDKRNFSKLCSTCYARLTQVSHTSEFLRSLTQEATIIIFLVRNHNSIILTKINIFIFSLAFMDTTKVVFVYTIVQTHWKSTIV